MPRMTPRASAVACIAAAALLSCERAPKQEGVTQEQASQPHGQAVASPEQDGEARIVGFAFVDASVTGEGSRATLPEGAKILPPGADVTGAEGCPSSRDGTDGLIVAVIDYRGRPTAASLTITRHPGTDLANQRPPRYLDLDAGRKVQYLGPLAANGSYSVALEYFFGEAATKSDTAELTLDRNCPEL
jgi:hypothetical protein